MAKWPGVIMWSAMSVTEWRTRVLYKKLLLLLLGDELGVYSDSGSSCTGTCRLPFHTKYTLMDAWTEDKVKILCDWNIQTDHVIEHKRLDVAVLDKMYKMCHLIDIAVLGDIRAWWIASKDLEKNQDLARKLCKIWQVKVRVVPVVVGALGTIPKALEKHLDQNRPDCGICSQEGGTSGSSENPVKDPWDQYLL